MGSIYWKNYLNYITSKAKQEKKAEVWVPSRDVADSLTKCLSNPRKHQRTEQKNGCLNNGHKYQSQFRPKLLFKANESILNPRNILCKMVKTIIVWTAYFQ